MIHICIVMDINLIVLIGVFFVLGLFLFSISHDRLEYIDLINHSDYTNITPRGETNHTRPLFTLHYDVRIALLYHEHSECCNDPTRYRKAICWNDYIIMLTRCSYEGDIVYENTLT